MWMQIASRMATVFEGLGNFQSVGSTPCDVVHLRHSWAKSKRPRLIASCLARRGLAKEEDVQQTDSAWRTGADPSTPKEFLRKHAAYVCPKRIQICWNINFLFQGVHTAPSAAAASCEDCSFVRNHPKVKQKQKQIGHIESGFFFKNMCKCKKSIESKMRSPLDRKCNLSTQCWGILNQGPWSWFSYPAKIPIDISALWPSTFCFWKPMRTIKCNKYYRKHNSTLCNIFSRISHSVQPAGRPAVASGKCLPSNVFLNNTVCEKHDARMTNLWKTVSFVGQTSPRKFCKCQSNLELVAIAFFLAFSFRCFDTDLFVILP